MIRAPVPNGCVFGALFILGFTAGFTLFLVLIGR